MAPRPADGSRPADAGRPGLVGALAFAIVSLLLIATASLAPASHAAGSPDAVPAARVFR